MVKNDDDVDEDQMGEERTHPWSTHHISLSNLNFLHTSRGKCFGLAIKVGSEPLLTLFGVHHRLASSVAVAPLVSQTKPLKRCGNGKLSKTS